MSKILLIDAESRDAAVLVHALTQDGYDVLKTSDLTCAAAKFVESQPSLVIADVYLPKADGLGMCRELRRISETPILVVSSASDQGMIVDALDAGADDYVVKPFGMHEMLARVRAALRRHRLRNVETAALEIGEFRIDVSGHRVYVRGQPVKLTPKEFDLLVYMARRPRRVLLYSELAREMWRADAGSDPAPLRVLAGNLRKKIESDPGRPRHLITHARVGYAFQPYLITPTDGTTSHGRGLNFAPSGSRL